MKKMDHKGQAHKPPVKGAGKPTPNKHVKPMTKGQKKSGTT